jgi:tetraacyldisaccharide 4'-kinase
MMEAFVRERVWTRRGLGGWLAYAALRPCSEIFRLAVALRSAAYGSGLLHTQRADLCVISVGNLTVGGTGKTPLALWLARRLAESGRRVALLSRGYGGSRRGLTVVSTEGRPLVGPDEVGDEPVMLAKCFGGPVITAPRRRDAAAEAVRLGCTVAVLDDGFQHRALGRDFDIVLYDGRRGPLLPAGPLREGPRALRRADALVLTGAAAAAAPPRELPDGVPTFRMTAELGALVESAGGVWQTHPPGRLAGKRVITVVGIAEPQRFYELVQRWDAQIEEVFEFPDHHRYTHADWQKIGRRSQECDLVVTTEKDLVKLEAFPFAVGKLVALRVEPVIDRAAELLAAVAERCNPDAAPLRMGTDRETLSAAGIASTESQA